jgi:hypothetical protein
LKNRQAGIEKRRRDRKEVEKQQRIAKQQRKSVIYQVVKTIQHYFPQLFDRLREIDDPRERSDYELAEVITACIAMFLLKEGSRNAMNNDREEGNFKENYQKIFKMRLPHMDTADNVMRVLQEEELQQLKTAMVRTLIEKKTLQRFRLFDKWYVVAVDGTGVMSFSKRHCEHCLTKTSKKTGKVTYFHNALEAKLVCSNGFSISLATEWIENPQGDFDKQDCETNAFKRLSKNLKKMHPRLPICIAADALYPNKSFLDICHVNDWGCTVTFKEGNLPSVQKEVAVLQGLTQDNKCTQTIIQRGKKIEQQYCWINDIDYQGYLINWIECLESVTDTKENTTNSRFVFLTTFKIIRSNAAQICDAARLRWKIENEGFNTQKNQGYSLQHKYSRVSWLAARNYYQCLQIAHLINQLVELSVEFKKLLVGKITIKHLWKLMVGLLILGRIDTHRLSILCQQRSQLRLE